MSDVLRERTDEKRRMVRFLGAGVVNTAFGYGVFGGVIALGFPLVVATLVATVCGVLFNFFLTGSYVFRTSALGRLPRFVVAYAIVWAVGTAIASVFVKIEPARIFETNALSWLGIRESSAWNDFVSGVLVFPFNVVTTYLLSKHWVFARADAEVRT